MLRQGMTLFLQIKIETRNMHLILVVKFAFQFHDLKAISKKYTYVFGWQGLDERDIVIENEQVFFEGAQEVHMDAQTCEAKTQGHFMIFIKYYAAVMSSDTLVSDCLGSQSN